MGCSSSMEIASPLEQKLIEAITQAKKGQGPQQKQSFNGLILAFPKLRPGFQKVHNVFHDVSNGTKRAPIEAVKGRCAELGLMDKNASVQELFKVADPAGLGAIDKDDLLVILMVVFLMEHGSGELIHSQEIRTALQILEKAFTYFDSSSDGYLEHSELLAALKSGTAKYDHKHGSITPRDIQQRNKCVSEMLFDMLDFDKSGRVSFKEFLLGIQKIVASSAMDDSDLNDSFRHPALADPQAVPQPLQPTTVA